MAIAAPFILMSEDAIFDCLGVASFKGSSGFDGVTPDSGDMTIVFDSVQRRDSGTLFAQATVTENDELVEESLRVGEEFWTRPTMDAPWVTSGSGLQLLFSEEGQRRLAVGGALATMTNIFGGGATEVGEVDYHGYAALQWEADAANIQAHFNALGISPVPAGISEGFIHVWTTREGLILQVDSEMRAEHVTLAGIPVVGLDPTQFGLPEDALDIVPDYAATYELFDFDHDVEIARPDQG